MRLLLVSEGALDVGTGQEDGSEGDERAAGSVLVRRLLEESSGGTCATGRSSARSPAHPRAERGGVRIPAQGAARHRGGRGARMHLRGHRGRPQSYAGGLAPRRAPRWPRARGSHGQPLAYNTALGVAVEMVEAWLLTDERALERGTAFGRHRARHLQSGSARRRAEDGQLPEDRLQEPGEAWARTAGAAPYDEVAARLRASTCSNVAARSASHPSQKRSASAACNAQSFLRLRGVEAVDTGQAHAPAAAARAGHRSRVPRGRRLQSPARRRPTRSERAAAGAHGGQPGPDPGGAGGSVQLGF